MKGDAAPVGGRKQQLKSNSQLTENDLFELLSNQRRRYILHTLMRDWCAVTVGDLSQEIAAWEDDVDYEAVTSSDRKRVYTALRQAHLPKMDKAGVLSFDKDRGIVEPTPALEDIEIYMDVVHGQGIPWSDYYLVLTGISGALFAAAVLQAPLFGDLTMVSWGAFVIVVFAVSSLAHRYYSQKNRLGIQETPPEYNTDGRDHQGRRRSVVGLITQGCSNE